MTAVRSLGATRALYGNYLRVLDELTLVAELEGQAVPRSPGSLPSVRRQERLAQDYALLTAAVRPHLPALSRSGVLDADQLERRVRHLSAVMKENQRRLNANRLRTAQRADAVMRVIMARDGGNDNAASTAACPEHKA